MIRWRLRVLMAERNINNKTLAQLTGLHPTTISRLKNTDELKQITGEALDALCNVLVCTPNDLIEFTPDGDSRSESKTTNSKTIELNRRTTVSSRNQELNDNIMSAA